MKHAVKTIGLFVLPAGSLLALGYMGSRLWLMRSIFKHWINLAEKNGYAFVTSRYRKAMGDLSIPDLFLLYRYTDKVVAEASEDELLNALDKVNQRNIFQHFDKNSLAEIIEGGQMKKP